jgi:hypothetical protein
MPITRDTLMTKRADQIAIATHGDTKLGFGAVAAVYTLLTPEREAQLGDALAEDLAKVRKGAVTKRLENPPELLAAAREVAQGSQSLETLFAAAMRWCSPALASSPPKLHAASPTAERSRDTNAFALDTAAPSRRAKAAIWL